MKTINTPWWHVDCGACKDSRYLEAPLEPVNCMKCGSDQLIMIQVKKNAGGTEVRTREGNMTIVTTRRMFFS